MKWDEFKKKVDESIIEQGADPEDVDIAWIDIGDQDWVDIEIDYTAGDGSLIISN